MYNGFLRVACGNIHTTIADPVQNADEIIRLINEAESQHVKLLSFGELTLSGYTCEDLFFQDILQNICEKQLIRIVDYAKNINMVIVVGLPIVIRHKLYNVAAILYQGKILGFVPKTNLPNYNEFYEARHFESAPEKNETILFHGREIPFGTKMIFTNQNMSDFSFGIEMCEDLWVPDPPSTTLALNGAMLIVNPSASNQLTGKSDYRRLLIQSTSARLICGYIYSNAGVGESTTDVVFSGHCLIGENGTILSESPVYYTGLTIADIDLSKLNSERRRMTTYHSLSNYQEIYFDLPKETIPVDRFYDPHPFVPSNEQSRQKRCEEVFHIQMMGLRQRLQATHTTKAVIGISGGLDSTLALLVTTMTFQELGYPMKNIYAITMPCFGTTSRTLNNSLGLMEELGVTVKTIPIQEAVQIHFRDIEHNENIHDVTYENVQARERTQILMDLSNQVGGIVIGTGDLSEIALGWSTYNGDHMSMYAVNCSVPKTLVRYLIDYIASIHQGEKLELILKDILDTPVSPELIPHENNQIVQKTEDLVGPYELHDFFLYHVVRFGCTPKKMLLITKLAFGNQYDEETILKWLKKFYRRFISQQFKRSCIPDGPKVGSVALSPRGDFRCPSDASYMIWLSELKNL